MRLFKSDLCRNFAIGFAVGALIVGVQSGPGLLDQLAPPAQAHALAEAGAR